MNQVSITHEKGVRSLAWSMLILFVSSLFTPALVRASGGGPTQPEVQGFTPIGVSDMVDPFTGDFTYNIPLMDVEGYPINIAYSSGITMDQEASWVGLGWSLNMGSVVRNMRGLPDDFNGDEVQKTVSQKPTTNIGLDLGADFELFGYNDVSGSNDTAGLGNISVSFGVGYNNYRGYNSELSISSSFSFAKKMGVGFELTGSSENGASFAPNLSLTGDVKKKDLGNFDVKNTIGIGMNSRAGLQSISYSRSLSQEATNRKGSMAGSYNVGLAQYSPTAGPSMFGISLAGKVNIGTTLFATDPTFSIGFTYSRQWIPNDNKTIENPAYGYFNLDAPSAATRDKALLDFNRDDDASFTKYSTRLPSAFLTYDIYSVNAQGTGGSFRGFRNDVGYVYDPKVTSSDASGSAGFELGLGNLTDIGVDISVAYTSTSTGLWSNNNDALDALQFQGTTAGEWVPAYAMQEANERSVDRDNMFESDIYGKNTVYFPLRGPAGKFTKIKPELISGTNVQDIESNQRSIRVISNNLMSFLTNNEVFNGVGINEIHPLIYSGYKGHHIGQIVQTGMDGRRYVFGLPAYNHFQEDATFAIGKKLNGDFNPAITIDEDLGLINYGSTSEGDELASVSNDWGIDEYYSSTTTPAYTHSHLLTAVLSEDYVDADLVKGPSDNDLGSYVKFSYTKVDNHKWRTPLEANSAYYNEGLRSDPTDDKASFVYGEKDLWYVKAVETKNYIAIFEVENRKDGKSALGRHGDTIGGQDQQLLRRILLFSKPEYLAHQNNLSAATPLQVVEFEYNYSLCRKYPANSEMGSADTTKGGKLTLLAIKFSYQGSKKMVPRSYRFEYNSLNPSYNMKASDRWGTYKPNPNIPEDPFHPGLNTAEWPYTDQNKTTQDQNAAAWSLTDIKLPSGGRIHVDYESDDYAYVQNLSAARMFKIVDVLQVQPMALVPSNLDGDVVLQNISDNSGSYEKNKDIVFEMLPGFDDPNDYVKVGQQLYFRALMKFREGSADDERNYDYVSGFGKVRSVTKLTSGGVNYGVIAFEPEALKDCNNCAEYSPITKAAIQMGRLHMSRYIYDLSMGNEPTGNEQGITQFANAVASSVTSFGELFTGPNLAVYKKDRGTHLLTNKSWIRLMDPTKKKLGGGSRVREIRMYDNWGDMATGNTADNYFYGQRFTYELEDGTSSGVASYEPQIGGDENPWHSAEVVNNVKRFSPDDQLYLENPIMESQFPNPSVGYSRVTITDLPRANVNRTATGRVVKEFFTAKDFPTIVSRSKVDLNTRNSFLPIGPKYQYLNASQGYKIELNDMHGKAKMEQVFAEDKSEPISWVKYVYQTDAYNTVNPFNGQVVNSSKLNNTVKIVRKNGTTEQAEIGVREEAVADFREDRTLSIGGQVQINTNGLLFGTLPIVIPTVYPSLDVTENRFRSATLSKTIYRFGVLDTTQAYTDGSIVTTRNLAYDEQTGDVLVTQTTTNFNDHVYSLNYPAYWKYDEMGPAYVNTGFTAGVTGFSSNGFAAVSPSQNYFVPGDEVKITPTNSPATTLLGWILEVTGSGIVVVDRNGAPIQLSSNASVKVVRSGRRNKQGTSMASLTSLENPISGLTSNNFNKVLNAGAVEFGQDWKTYCNCFAGPTFTTNPYVLGTKGTYRPIRSFTHLSGRTQSDFDNNTNIRKDGVFTSYTPYYKRSGSSWAVDGNNWTFVSEVTSFSPNGMTLETRDALGRYSASQFGFNNTLTTAVAANTKTEELAVGNFEDESYSNCMEQGFFDAYYNPQTNAFEDVNTQIITDQQAHTGRNSIRVTAASPVVFKNTLSSCEETSCNITVKTDLKEYSFLDAVLPLQVEFTSVSGFLNAEMLDDDSFILDGTSQGYPVLEVLVTDANGCKAKFVIAKNAAGVLTITKVQ